MRLPVRAKVAPPPPRARRLLWDQFHSLKYPPAYLPRDNLDVKSDILDWHGDHPHTNFHGMFNTLRDKGYYLEVCLGGRWGGGEMGRGGERRVGAGCVNTSPGYTQTN